MQEKVFRIGQGSPLNGVLCLPGGISSAKTCVLILNSGLMHHVGTSRVSVTIARQLAETGIMSVRFDFSGIGDSPAKRGATNFVENSKNEVTDVIETIAATYGIKHFILYGLCSGADISFAAAQTDERVKGIVQIDPYLYRNSKWYVKHYGAKLLNPVNWLDLVKRVIGKTGSQKSGKTEEEVISSTMVETADDAREVPPKEEVERGYQKLLGHSCSVLVVITGGQIYTYNYAQQFRDLFANVDWQGQLTDYFFPEAEHILPEPKYQEEIINLIVSWVSKQVKN